MSVWQPGAEGLDDPVLLVGAQEHFDACGLSARFSARSWTTISAEEASRARWLAAIQRISLIVVAGTSVVVDAVLESLRAVTRAPIVVLGDFEASVVVRQIEAGADAVVDPGADPDALFARVVSVLRRADQGWVPGVRYLRAGPLRVDLWARECAVEGEFVHVAPTEYDLLVFVMTHPLVVLPIDEIVDQVWGGQLADGTNALRIAVNRLRKKLGDDPNRPRFVESVRGRGYRFVESVREIGDDGAALEDPSGEMKRLRSVAAIADALQHSTSAVDAADRFLGALAGADYADVMAVFEVVGDELHLLGDRNNSDRWRSSVAAGVPLSESDAAGYSTLHGEIVAISDITATERFSPTAERLAADGLRSCLFLPIIIADEVRGSLGLARRTRQPFDVASLVHLRTACAVLALALGTGRLVRDVPRGGASSGPP